MKSLFLAFFLALPFNAADWQSHFAKIPINPASYRASLTPPVDLILTNFQPTAEIRCVVLMPGAADQLYFFDWGQITLPPNPTLLDAVTILTNQAKLGVTVEPPFLLIHMAIDQTKDPLLVGRGGSLEKLNARKLPRRTYFLDRPYDRIVPQAEKITRLRIKPSKIDPASWHFYRLAFVGYDLNAAEFLRALAYGTKTIVQIEKRKAVFIPLDSIR